MKRIIMILSAAITIFIASCGKEDLGNKIDFSNTLNPYVALRSTDTVDAVEGDSVSVAVGMRTAFQQNVTVYYSVSAPINLKDQTFVIARNLLRATGKFVVPAGAVTDPSGVADATVAITKAVTDDGEALTLGRYNDSTTQVFDVHITKP